ncbi:MAG: 6-carboxytetrahydropterin synthase [Bryobacteraceae bacterium]|jgi:6-pyruvoyltetrahydropterin/6-carboxytetrahydropterin synthase
MRLTRRYRFSASHRLHAPALDDERNREIYGKCNNPYGHGHDYTLEVVVAGEPASATGRLIALGELDRLVESVILKAMDRRDLNSQVEEFGKLVPTTENLAAVVAARLAKAWPAAFAGTAARLEKVRIHETKRNIFEVRLGPPEAAGDVPRGGPGTQIKANQ